MSPQLQEAVDLIAGAVAIITIFILFFFFLP